MNLKKEEVTEKQCLMSKYKIIGYNFNSQKSIQEAAKKILYRYDVDTCLNKKELAFMLEYWELFHYRWEEKRGNGIFKIWRRWSVSTKGKRAFFIERNDGTTTDISYIISNIKNKTPISDFKKALRGIIKPQIYEFKNDAFRRSCGIICCPITGETVTKKSCHIDHFKPTFKEIVKNFIKEKGIIVSKDIIKKSEDWSIQKELTSDVLSFMFYDYHKNVAQLRVTSAKGNLTRKK